MSSQLYHYCLPSNASSGEVNGIRIRWRAAALGGQMEDEMERLKQSQALLKAATEHFLYLACYRLGFTDLKIMAPPHTFTTDTANGSSVDEKCEHVTGEVSTGPFRGSKLHVYIEGPDWNNMSVVGESFVQKGTGVIDQARSWGVMGVRGNATSSTSGSRAGPSATASSATYSVSSSSRNPVSSSSHYPSTGASTGSGASYGATASHGATASYGATATTAQYSPWQQDQSGYWTRYNYTSQQWEYQ
ncbi:hypothetical protein HD806DRAFT_316988 [Xylariaceae sp. AK1471]|nr:hypothetical protein HD806DRAFT_316988 [Xylariaceae sp. AK1471]